MGLTRSLRVVALCCVSAIGLAGCADPMIRTTYDSTEVNTSALSGVNEGYIPGSLAVHHLQIPSLKEMRDLHYVEDKDAKKEKEEQQRLPVIKQAGLKYGMQMGLAYGAQQIQARLNHNASRLSQTFNFLPLMLPGPDGKMIMPPVISEMDDTFESQNSGQSIRISDKSYNIIREASLASNVPLWHTYLFRSYRKAQPPSNKELPRNGRETRVWEAAVTEGFDQGVKQSLTILREDKARLVRDFNGMVLYKQLIDEGKVTAPVIAEVNMGLTGNGRTAHYNDRTISITSNSRLNVDSPGDMKSLSGSTPPVDGVATPQVRDDEQTGGDAPSPGSDSSGDDE